MRLFSHLPPVGLIAALFGASVAAMILLGSEERAGPEATTRGAGSASIDKLAPALILPPLSGETEAFAAFDSRPLLIEGRRRPTPINTEPSASTRDAPELQEEFVPALIQDAVSPTVPPDPPEIVMIGMIEDHGSVRALIKDLQTGEEIWRGEGELMGSWTLAKITHEYIQLEADGTEITFNLFGEHVP